MDHYEGWRRTGRGAKHYGDILQQCDPKPHHYRFETPNGFWCGEALWHEGRIT